MLWPHCPQDGLESRALNYFWSTFTFCPMQKTALPEHPARAVSSTSYLLLFPALEKQQRECQSHPGWVPAAQWLCGLCLGVASCCKVPATGWEVAHGRGLQSVWSTDCSRTLRWGFSRPWSQWTLPGVCRSVTLPDATWVGTVRKRKLVVPLQCIIWGNGKKKVCDHNVLCIWRGTEWKFSPGIAVPDITNLI